MWIYTNIQMNCFVDFDVFQSGYGGAGSDPNCQTGRGNMLTGRRRPKASDGYWRVSSRFPASPMQRLRCSLSDGGLQIDSPLIHGEGTSKRNGDPYPKYGLRKKKLQSTCFMYVRQPLNFWTLIIIMCYNDFELWKMERAIIFIIRPEIPTIRGGEKNRRSLWCFITWLWCDEQLIMREP